MKLMVVLVQDKDSKPLLSRLVEREIPVTKVASTGGFFKEGKTTLLIGVHEKQQEEVLEIIKQNCHLREQLVSSVSPVGGSIDGYIPYPAHIQIGGATVFVISVDQFEQF